MGGEDHGAVLDLIEAGHAVIEVDQLHAVLGEFVHNVGVVYQVAQHVDGSLVLRAGLVGEANRINHAVAEPAGRYA